MTRRRAIAPPPPSSPVEERRDTQGMTTKDSLSHFSDAELLNEVKRLAGIEREVTAGLIRSLAEVEVRRLHLASGEER